jgi:hypothetical protein
MDTKLCECGCGHPTAIATSSRARTGHVKGQPLRFARGHKARKPITGYRRTYIGGETIAVHRLRAEKALGRPLPAGAVVHHADGSKDEGAQLVICQDNGYHRLLHARMRIKAAGGDPNTHRVCCGCQLAKPIANFNRRRSGKGLTVYGLEYYCRDCQRLRNAKRCRDDRGESVAGVSAG